MNPQPSATGPALRDIHLPPAPPWWPPAPGWWVLAGLLLLITLAALWWLAQHRATARRRRRWLDELAHLRDDHVAAGDVAAFAAGVQRLLRRVARAQAPAAPGARGAAWRAVLARVRVDGATLDLLAELDAAIYAAHPVLDGTALNAAASTWLRAAARPRGWRRLRERRHA